MCAATGEREPIRCDVCDDVIVAADEASDDEGALCLALIDRGGHWCVWNIDGEPQEQITCRKCRDLCAGCLYKPRRATAPMLNEECET